ncbi:MAG: DUF1572 family protein [Saprospiraceae bacterium]|nr:DUF1572 family protein [Saprospiraceae bacterium]
MRENYFKSIVKQFEFYKFLGESTFDQLDESHLFWQFNEESNSIAIIVNHLRGNMMSRWTDFLITDGEKESRQRDLEFEKVIKTKKELYAKWSQGWICLFNALNEIDNDSIKASVYIRNQEHTLIEAINRQLSHYSYHIGQIIYIGRMIKGSEWKSLSIPKGNSKQYNLEKFSMEKRKIHYTEEFLKNKKTK